MAVLVDAEGALGRALGRLSARGVYADVLAESAGGYRVRVERGVTTAAPSPEMQGAIFRAWTGERWTETVSRSLDEVELARAVEALDRQLGNRAGPRPPPPGDSPTGHSESSTSSSRPITDVPIEDLIERARSWHLAAVSVPGISNAFGSIAFITNERLFLSNSGARRHQSIHRVNASVLPLAIENGRVEYDPLIEGYTGGAEVLDRFTESAIHERARLSVELLKAGAAPTGPMRVLLDPSTAGTFAHESFGHGTEADQLLRDRSYLKPLLGQMLGPDEVTLVDDGVYPGGWGSLYFDDEGFPAQRTVLVDRGRFVEVLHDRETAHALGRQPTGNARRADFLSRTFVRMTNTYIEPGDWSFEELVQETGDGVLLERCTSGIEDPLGGQMQIKVKRARRIEHGALTTPYSSMALSGRVLDFLRSIRGVGRKEYFEISPGLCGKGHTDLLPAGTGGTYLLSQAVVGPA